jgi:hypothetical protein
MFRPTALTTTTPAPARPPGPSRHPRTATTILLTCAGALAATLALAKDKPAERMKPCPAYGAGFFYVPGTDTCVKIGGYVGVDVGVQAPAGDRSGGGNAPATLVPSGRR